ncbi:hypothetical protein E2562_021777 [Oryza meyeriana var. granulata]|uniref:Uncharacterized protein n=1 Tax=Oryza meyeriana var. granulata TaxID=110450 RepID=A0A6G1EY69_9ORYZ|nr:hypothetical protein E2562_021777 [Oryza meyeriana var. granulata]
MAAAATELRAGALGTPAGCCGGRVRALPNGAACPRRRSAGKDSTASSSATSCRRGGATKVQLPGIGCRRSRPRVSCSGTRWAIWRVPGAPDAGREELVVVSLEDVTVELKPWEPLRRRRLRVEVETTATSGSVCRASRRQLRAPKAVVEVISVHGCKVLLHR